MVTRGTDAKRVVLKQFSIVLGIMSALNCGVDGSAVLSVLKIPEASELCPVSGGLVRLCSSTHEISVYFVLTGPWNLKK